MNPFSTIPQPSNEFQVLLKILRYLLKRELQRENNRLLAVWKKQDIHKEIAQIKKLISLIEEEKL